MKKTLSWLKKPQNLAVLAGFVSSAVTLLNVFVTLYK